MPKSRLGVGAMAVVLLLSTVASADRHCRKVKKHRKYLHRVKEDAALYKKNDRRSDHRKIKGGAEVKIKRVGKRLAQVRRTGGGRPGWVGCKYLERLKKKARAGRTRRKKRVVTPAPSPPREPRPAPAAPPPEPPRVKPIAPPAAPEKPQPKPPSVSATPKEPERAPPVVEPARQPPVASREARPPSPAAPEPAKVARTDPPPRLRPRPVAAPPARVAANSEPGADRDATIKAKSSGPAPSRRRFQLGAAVHANALLLSPMLVEPSRNRYFDPGTLYPGVSLWVGYDLGAALSFFSPDLWLSANVGLMFNLGEALDTTLLDIQLLVQKRFRLSKRLGLSLGIGPSLCVALLSLHRVEGTSEGDLATAVTVGLAGAAGLDLVVTSGLRLSLSVMWRQHFVSVEEFGVGVGTWRPGGAWEGDAFSTTYSGLSAGLGASWLF